MTLLAEIVVVVLAAIGVAVGLALLPHAPRQTRRRSRAPQPPRCEQLARLERLVGSSASSALQAHAYLRPVLGEIAARRLAAHGQTLARLSDGTGERMLGERLWDMVRPDRPFPLDRHGPGVAHEELDEMLTVLERL